MIGRVLTLLIVIVFSSPAYAQQVRKSVYFGIGKTEGFEPNPSGITLNSGFALAIKLSDKFFLRPVVGGGRNYPDDKSSFANIHALGLLGYRMNSRLNVLGGGGAIFLFPENPYRLGTGAISLSAKLSQHYILFAPVSFTERGVNTQLQIGYIW